MADDIPFDKNLDLAPDTVDEPMPGLRRVMADNPGPFTFKGTLSYIIGAARSPSSIRAQTIRAAPRRNCSRVETFLDAWHDHQSRTWQLRYRPPRDRQRLRRSEE